MAAFKRKRVMAPRRGGFKKRRFGRRRVSRTKAFSSRSASGSTFGFRARRIPKRRYKSMLWNSTMFAQHYRSAISNVVAITATVGVTAYQTRTMAAIRASGNNFWQTAGGLQPNDSGVATGTYRGDLIIRGGTIGISFSNINSGATTQRVKAFLLKTAMEWNTALIPANVGLDFDPTLIPDFNRYIGRILMRRDFIVKNDDVFDLKYRLPIHKVDQEEFNNDRGVYMWFFLVNDVEGVATNMNVIRYHNVSFVGDTIT